MAKREAGTTEAHRTERPKERKGVPPCWRCLGGGEVRTAAGETDDERRREESIRGGAVARRRHENRGCRQPDPGVTLYAARDHDYLPAARFHAGITTSGVLV